MEATFCTKKVLFDQESLKDVRRLFGEKFSPRIARSDAEIIISEIIGNIIKHNIFPGYCQVETSVKKDLIDLSLSNPILPCDLDKKHRGIAQNLKDGEVTRIDFRSGLPKENLDSFGQRGMHILCYLCDQNDIKVSQRIFREINGFFYQISLRYANPLKEPA